MLDKLAEKGDWGKPLPPRTARGLAIHESFGTIVGEIAQVAVSKSGEVKVERVIGLRRLWPCRQPAQCGDADRERRDCTA